MWSVAVLVALCTLRTGLGLQPVLLHLQTEDVSVTATAECGDGDLYVVCPGSGECLRKCGGKDGTPHRAELAVDGDRTTSWQSPTATFYGSGEAPPVQSLTIDLGQASPLPPLQLSGADVFSAAAGGASGGSAGVVWRGSTAIHYNAVWFTGWRELCLVLLPCLHWEGAGEQSESMERILLVDCVQVVLPVVDVTRELTTDQEVNHNTEWECELVGSAIEALMSWWCSQHHLLPVGLRNISLPGSGCRQ